MSQQSLIMRDAKGVNGKVKGRKKQQCQQQYLGRKEVNITVPLVSCHDDLVSLVSRWKIINRLVGPSG